MRILTSWLREFVSFTVPVETLAKDLTMCGLEVEEVESVYKGLGPVVVGYVEQNVPHPNAPHLKICTVTTGEQKNEVVCGAPNVDKGQLVALARPGTELPDGTTVESVEIFGIRSDGMLCSEAELGIGQDKTGILILNPAPGVEAGRPLVEVLGLNDWILDIAVTPNRPDCLSVLGVAREVSAIYGIPLTITKSPNHQIPKSPNHQIPISIEDPDLCGRYTGAVMVETKVGPSPHWLATRLQASGIRPINNVVDVTNYILIEYGQPLHAFDLDRLTGPAIVVRTARPGEHIQTLDGKDQELQPGMLVIADSKRPVAIAGIMGGAETEVRDDTRRILIESALFAPIQVRRTARALKLITESSYRFERGIDPEGVIKALHRAVDLMGRVTGSRLAQNIEDVYPRPCRPRHLSLRPQKANRLLGIELESEKIAKLLESVGIELTHSGEECINGVAPTHRLDLKAEEDLIEEIARLHGFSRIPTLAPKAEMVAQTRNPTQDLADKIRSILTAQGMTEVISYSFLGPGDIEALGLAKDDPRMRMTRIQNPLSDDQSVMRTNLISSLMGAVVKNQAQRNLDLGLFEIGATFQDIGSGKLPHEEQRIAALCTGARNSESWSWSREQVDLFDLKGILEGLLKSLRISEWKTVLETPDDPFLLPGTSARIVGKGDSVLGSFGQIDPGVLEFWKIDGPVFVFDLSLHAIEKAVSRKIKFRPLARYPGVERDIAIIVADELSAHDLLEFISNRAADLLQGVQVFDVYRGKPIPKGSKSIGLRFRYRAPDHTLSDREVSDIHDPLVLSMLQFYNAKLRD